MNHINLPSIKMEEKKTGFYLAESLGAPFDVYLANGVKEEVDISTGKETVAITDLPGLIASIVRARVFHQRKLSGADMKFVRTAVGLKSKVLAEAVDLSPEHYSRCESGQKTLSPTAEKIYRGYIFLATFMQDKNFQKAVEEYKCGKEEISKEDAKEALAKFQKLFFEMKISPVCDSNEPLQFVFKRRSFSKGTPCDGDDTKWGDAAELNQQAA